jgi:hypothetical protein
MRIGKLTEKVALPYTDCDEFRMPCLEMSYVHEIR